MEANKNLKDITKLVLAPKYAQMIGVTKPTAYKMARDKKVKSCHIDGVLFIELES